MPVTHEERARTLLDQLMPEGPTQFDYNCLSASFRAVETAAIERCLVKVKEVYAAFVNRYEGSTTQEFSKGTDQQLWDAKVITEIQRELQALIPSPDKTGVLKGEAE